MGHLKSPEDLQWKREEKDGVVTFTPTNDNRGSLDHLMVDGQFSDKLMIRSPKDWLYDFLPVKNHKIRDGHHPSFGCMIEGDERTVYRDDLKTQVATYKDIDELLAAGWIVD